MAAIDAQGNEVGKLFVGGLHQITTNASLKAYFFKFGDIEESVVMMDNRTGRSRGFGYIKFKDDSAVDSVLAQKPHVIDHKEVDPKRCNVNMKGKVTEVNLLTSPNKQRHRGFAFVGFEDEEVVKNLIHLHYLTMDGKQVEVKAMEPPISQRLNYVPPSIPFQLSTNGRPVRGGRNGHFPQMSANDSYASWSPWPGGWNSAACNPGPQHQWPQSPFGWNGAAAGAGGGPGASGPTNQHHGIHSSPGHGNHMSSFGPASTVGWPEQTGASTNGWMPPGWGPQTAAAAPSTNRSYADEGVPMYNSSVLPLLPSHSTDHRKPCTSSSTTTWDSLCLAALHSGANAAGPNVGNHHPQMDNNSWNHHPPHPAVVAAAMQCQLQPMPMVSGSAGAVGAPGHSEWNSGGGGPGTAGGSNPHHAWTGSMQHAARNGTTNGGGGTPSAYLGEASHHHPSQTPDSALAAYVHSASQQAAVAYGGMGGASGAGGHGGVLPPWATSASGPGDPNNMKQMDDSIYRSSAAFGLSSAQSVSNNNSVLSHANGMLNTDWHAMSAAAAVAAGGPVSQPGYHHHQQQQTHHLYKH